ncbi:MAG: sulfite exporter TauE/SafE family protein [Bacteroidota bacterium]
MTWLTAISTPENWTWLASAFLLGLTGSLHCVVMCGPLMLAVPVGQGPSWQRWLGRGTYQFGRLMTYGLLGGLVGVIGWGGGWTPWSQGLSVLAGLVLLTLGVLGLQPDQKLPAWFRPYWMKWQGTAARNLKENRLPALFQLGFLNGLLPCGMVYIALAGAAVQGRVEAGALYMLSFGLGTLPALGVLLGAQAAMPGKLRQWSPMLMRGAMLVLGGWLVWRGLGMVWNPGGEMAGCG